MIQKVGLALGGLVASMILAVGLAAAGFAPRPADPAPTADAAPEAVGFLGAAGIAGDPSEGALVDADVTEVVEPQVVYIEPAGTPEVRIERVARRRELGDDDEGWGPDDEDDDDRDASRERDDSHEGRREGRED